MRGNINQKSDQVEQKNLKQNLTKKCKASSSFSAEILKINAHRCGRGFYYVGRCLFQSSIDLYGALHWRRRRRTVSNHFSAQTFYGDDCSCLVVVVVVIITALVSLNWTNNPHMNITIYWVQYYLSLSLSICLSFPLSYEVLSFGMEWPNLALASSFQSILLSDWDCPLECSHHK